MDVESLTGGMAAVRAERYVQRRTLSCRLLPPVSPPRRRAAEPARGLAFFNLRDAVRWPIAYGQSITRHGDTDGRAMLYDFGWHSVQWPVHSLRAALD